MTPARAAGPARYVGLLAAASLAGPAGAQPPAGAAAVYDTATAHARLGHADSALVYLDRAVAAGFRQAARLRADSSFAPVRGDPRFARAVAAIERAITPCASDPMARRFDFWAGEWDVFAAGGPRIGRSAVERVSGQCALLEHWTDLNAGTSGKSLNAYNAALGRWQQYWVGQLGGVTEYRESTWRGPSLVFLARGADARGRPRLTRLTFTPLAPDSVRQLFETSADGATWTAATDLLYVRRP